MVQLNYTTEGICLKYTDINDIYLKATELKGKTFGEIDKQGRLDNHFNKGGYGHVIEESHFGYSINSDRNPDFNEAGVEMKVTPIKKNKNGTYSAKERLVLNIINFNTEITKTFRESDFWKKNEILLLIFYLYNKELSRTNQKIIDSLIYKYPESDFKIIKNDWQHINNKIKAGKAHELSEADTMYLGACPKGANKANGMIVQPNSYIKAMRRAYAFKQSYMTSLVRKYVKGNETNKRIISKPSDLEKHSFEQLIKKKLSPYKNMTEIKLKRKFGINSKAKNINEILLGKMLGIDGKISKSEEFIKANIIPKTIRLNTNKTITESMSLSPFKYEELINELWEDSNLRHLFSSTKFLFVIFKFDSDKVLRFYDIKLWNMPLEDLDQAFKKVWQKTKDLVNNGDIVKRISKLGIRTTYFPTKSDNPVGHVRPHAQNAQNTYPLPVKDQLTGLETYTKHSFWLNNTYILKQIKDLI
jgi:DNA mismatch repair protein MutH